MFPARMKTNENQKVSYLLCLWRGDVADPAWHASLENPMTGERKGFADLEALFRFIRAETMKLPLDGESHADKQCIIPDP